MAFLIHTHHDRLNTPEWVALLAVGLFGIAGICIVAQSLRLQGLVLVLVCVLLGAMAVIPAWIALGPGPRQCTLDSVGARTGISEAACRGAFGACAVIVGTLFVFAVRAALRARRPS